MQILTTKNYNLFVRSPYNREVQKIGKIIATMKKYGWLDGYPIRVRKQDGGKLLIEDGQHRFEAARELKIPIKYVVATDKQNVSIPEINNAQRVWNIGDYVSSYAQQGKEDYIKLVRYSTENNISLGVSASLLTNNTRTTGGTDTSSRIRTGTFKITAELFANRVAEIVNYCAARHAFAKNRNFVAAIARTLLVTDASELKKRLQQNVHRITNRSSIDEYLLEIEGAYNYGHQKKLPVKFLAIQAVLAKCPIKKSERPQLTLI